MVLPCSHRKSVVEQRIDVSVFREEALSIFGALALLGAVSACTAGEVFFLTPRCSSSSSSVGLYFHLMLIAA